MRKKNIEGDSKEVQLDGSILITGNSHLLVKAATVFWSYKNVFTRFNDRLTWIQRTCHNPRRILDLPNACGQA